MDNEVAAYIHSGVTQLRKKKLLGTTGEWGGERWKLREGD